MEKLASFKVLGLSEDALKVLQQKGFEEPTPIQIEVIPVLLEGKIDIVGQAQTGTGKTAAFGLPIIERLDVKSNFVQAIILTPTRELTIQVAEELVSLKGKKKIKILPVYGGQSMELQLKHLKRGVQIVVGTPGRIIDHLKRKTLRLENTNFCVLDEADEMLNMGFLEDVKTILEYTNSSKRTLMFSATMPKEILNVAETYMRDYEFIKAKKEQLTVPQTDQIYFQVRESDKFEALCRIIDVEESFYGLVFCRTKVDADRISNHLIDRGYDADTIHGDLSQSQREKVMNKFKKHRVNILVATDVAARGIDVSDLTHVINYAFPQDPESYIHRIGRTGRAGKEGTAVTFITPSEERRLLYIERKTKTKIRKEKLPKVKDIIKSKKTRIKLDLENIIKSGLYSDYLSMAQDLIKEEKPDKILAALIKYSFEDELDVSNYNEIRDTHPKIPGQTRLFIARGKKSGMTPKKLTNFITERAEIQSKKIKDILIQEDFSFVTVPFKEAEFILQSFKRRKHGKRPLVEKAKPKK